MAKAAAYADDYVLTHKSPFNKNRSFGPTKKSYPEVGKKSENVAPEKSSDKGQTSNQRMSKDRKPKSFAPVCHYCKKPGHVMSDCWLLERRSVWFETEFSFSEHVKRTCKACFLQMRDLRRIRQYLTSEVAVLAANALVSSRLDYCNSCFNQHKLQSIQNTLARLLQIIESMLMLHPF